MVLRCNFYSCKIFGLRGRDEHRNLECSQFELGQDSKGKFVRSIGRNTNTFSGGLAHLTISNKDIKHYTGSVYIHDHRAAISPRLFARPSCN